MRWLRDEKLKMVLEYKNSGFILYVSGCKRKTFTRKLVSWTRVYDLYGESGLEHRVRH